MINKTQTRTKTKSQSRTKPKSRTRSQTRSQTRTKTKSNNNAIELTSSQKRFTREFLKLHAHYNFQDFNTLRLHK